KAKRREESVRVEIAGAAGGPRSPRGQPAPSLPFRGDIWFDDVDPADIEAAIGPEAAAVARRQLGGRERSVMLAKEQAFGGLTRALAMDCEMVGVGPAGEDSIAARVSIVNQFGKCVYDKYVKPTQQVTDYRTAVSGIRPEHLKQGGSCTAGDCLDHPKKKIRDTQKYKPFKSQVKSGRPSLKLLAERILGVSVQQAEHCSVSVLGEQSLGLGAVPDLAADTVGPG
ncbi:RNA exonuclease 4-like, partial [Pteropus vampyrus]|uniref:RNA exonuclease 4-like n=1 Tax=Pteropus vampyrus TaxID=132908 RepID=A0A6P6C5E0_PTEVA